MWTYPFNALIGMKSQNNLELCQILKGDMQIKLCSEKDPPKLHKSTKDPSIIKYLAFGFLGIIINCIQKKVFHIISVLPRIFLDFFKVEVEKIL